MNETMPQHGFYAKVRHGMPAIIARWLDIGRGEPDRLALILAETARVAKLGEPDDTPDGAMLRAWADPQASDEVPLWAGRTAVFLLVQMPARPLPGDDAEACAWAYCWLRNRNPESFEAAREALPEHLREPLEAALKAAWTDRQGLRLV
ncbi:hypothetical protein FHR96_003628 [Halomonas organivorans]|uniref:Uncharacterized protein n=2 Tax=Halomonas organivorans TaxID=257772 RepID=A0A7W5G7A2_9GAMM|nr:hypothetical protein [Halomonas organivorans]